MHCSVYNILKHQTINDLNCDDSGLTSESGRGRGSCWPRGHCCLPGGRGDWAPREPAAAWAVKTLSYIIIIIRPTHPLCVTIAHILGPPLSPPLVHTGDHWDTPLGLWDTETRLWCDVRPRIPAGMCDNNIVAVLVKCKQTDVFSEPPPSWIWPSLTVTGLTGPNLCC